MEQAQVKPIELVVEDNRATLEIDGVTYVYTMANAEPAYKAFKAACAVLKDANKDSSIIAVIASNLGHSAVEACEKLVRANLSVKPVEGDMFKINDRFDSHFNKHRKHLILVMVNGMKYQFGDFFDMSVLGL